MASKKNIWFQIGHALERARLTTPSRPRSVKGLADRSRARIESALTRGDDRDALIPARDDLVAAGAALVADRVLAHVTGRRHQGVGKLVRAGLAGAAASLLLDLVRPLVNAGATRATFDGDTADRMLAGAGQGVLYGALVEPLVPGGALMKGAIYGSAEHMTSAGGGLSGLLGSHTPQRKLPLVGRVFDGLDVQDRAYLEHVVFGIAVAVIYESSLSRSGILPDES